MKARLAGILIVLFAFAVTALTPVRVSAQNTTGDLDITSDGKAYKSYLAVPEGAGPFPAIVLIHSFNGLEEGYRVMTDNLAKEGFVVLALGWQTFEKSPADGVVQKLVEDSIAYLSGRTDVNKDSLGLTGFCAGGRYTMLLLPQIKAFKAGVAWYGFPDRGEPSATDLIKDLESPMLIIHGTEDQPSPIEGIFKYATELRTAKKAFELKIYSGMPHGFMLQEGKLRTDDIGMDAFGQMATYFKRQLAPKSAS
jgi:carboxymethylenebutenolidase